MKLEELLSSIYLMTLLLKVFDIKGDVELFHHLQSRTGCDKHECQCGNIGCEVGITVVPIEGWGRLKSSN